MTKAPLTVAVTGSSGFIGSHLVPRLRRAGMEVLPVVRREPAREGEVGWDPAAGRLDGEALARAHAVVHLAGESIAGLRWTEGKRRRILESRRSGTDTVARALAATRPAGRVLISASGVGYYGDRGEEVLDEGSPPGSGFLAEVCRAWEDATGPAVTAGVRVVRLRLGVVLSLSGGSLPLMALPFRLGLGGPVGSGRQWVSWIALEDLLRVVEHLLGSEMGGAVNAVAPHPVRNRELATTLGAVLGRPARLRVPAIGIRTILGEMGERLLLDSARVAPARLADEGFRFGYPTLEDALRRDPHR